MYYLVLQIITVIKQNIVENIKVDVYYFLLKGRIFVKEVVT